MTVNVSLAISRDHVRAHRGTGFSSPYLLFFSAAAAAAAAFIVDRRIPSSCLLAREYNRLFTNHSNTRILHTLFFFLATRQRVSLLFSRADAAAVPLWENHCVLSREKKSVTKRRGEIFFEPRFIKAFCAEERRVEADS